MKGASEVERSAALQPIVLQASASSSAAVPPGADYNQLVTWAQSSFDKPRRELESVLVEFQRNFVGGKGRDVEALVTAGGSRSVNFAFETVLAMGRKVLGSNQKCKVLTGNPHLVVERAERRFQFQLVRVDTDG